MFSADVALAEEEDIVYEQYRVFNAKGELEANWKKKFHVSYFREDTARDDGDGPCTSSYVTYGDIADQCDESGESYTAPNWTCNQNNTNYLFFR